MAADPNRDSEDLDRLLQACWGRLESAAGNRRDPFHIMAVASIGMDGRPRARNVVLRAVEADARLLAFHSDARSPKIAELERDPRVSLLFYDKQEGLQLRLEAHAQVHRDDERAEAAWRAGRRFARRCYLQEAGPSTPSAVPTSGLPDVFEGREPTEEELLPARENFTVVTCRAERLDWFSLAHDGHRRAEWRWAGAEGTPQAGWLVP